jgi:hypothetical protein
MGHCRTTLLGSILGSWKRRRSWRGSASAAAGGFEARASQTKTQKNHGDIAAWQIPKRTLLRSRKGPHDAPG